MEERAKDERREFIEFLDALFVKLDEEKERLEKKRRKWMRFGKFVSLRLPQTLFEGVEEVAYETGQTVSEVIRRAVKEFLSNSKELLKENSDEDKQVENKESKEALKQFLAEHEDEIKAYFKEKENNERKSKETE
jgi:predicted DNA-binding protein